MFNSRSKFYFVLQKFSAVVVSVRLCVIGFSKKELEEKLLNSIYVEDPWKFHKSQTCLKNFLDEACARSLYIEIEHAASF